MQYRVQIQRDRIADLERRHAERDHITVAEARELFRLRGMISRRQANRAWLSLNRDRSRMITRQWRVSNPGCG